MTPIIPNGPSPSRPPGKRPPPVAGNIEDYRWLVSPDAASYLAKAADTGNGSLVKITLALRKELGPPRTHLVIAQTELRRRAGVKFRKAKEMFFTRQLLEQSTDERISAYKAGRLPSDVPVIDLCCGIGGDLMGLADRGSTVAVDRDPIATLLAEANCRVNGLENVEVRAGDVSEQKIDEFGAWHLDPDRRTDGKRSIKLENHDPGPEVIEQLLAANDSGVIKLAPAARVSEEWAQKAEVEWIGNRGECKQQVLWFNELARYPGERVATIMLPGTTTPYFIHGLPTKDLPVAEKLGRYVYEPHAAVLAAHLTGILSKRHDLPCISPKIPYLTSDKLVSDAALSCFEVEEVLQVDPKHMRSAIRKRRIGNLEVKKRGVRVDPEDIRKQINPRGDESGTLIIVPVNKKVSALLAQRISTSGA